MNKFTYSVGVTLLTLSMAACQSSCVKAPAELPADAVLTWQANEAVIAIDSVQDVAIGLNKVQICTPVPETSAQVCHPALSDNNTRHVINAVEVSLKTIGEVPSGWKATANAAIDEIVRPCAPVGAQPVPCLDDFGRAKLRPYIEAARGVINALVKGEK